MKILFCACVVLLSLSVNAKVADKGLPFEADTTKIQLNKIAQGTQVQLDFQMTLPSTQKLNKGAPSFVGVYERTKKSDWKEIQRIDLNQFYSLSDELHFSKNITLEHADSEVAVHSTIFHCGKAQKTACYIQGFLGKAKRQSKMAQNPHLKFFIEGKMR